MSSYEFSLIQNDWWTWLTFGIEFAVTLAAFFLSGNCLAAKLVAVMVGVANVIRAAIDAGNACGVKAMHSPNILPR